MASHDLRLSMQADDAEICSLGPWHGQAGTGS
eukprot:CAMPEP_0197677544 /NCGR_PEP_ID=MMETSP1338-20131121/88584_1 /TAXON_ID=43686 ORGANISM="Pelagodinium beii, Strain RCC1491" /NCGR_SAMPLE_ID=MMETSP1338 /ASSEMBLY_ACC=CAM_ASM_000754 /LENGTH=31 /DNA_ID= /DNA_START= /DNA_END= /DNA_ORIENTATION=